MCNQQCVVDRERAGNYKTCFSCRASSNPSVVGQESLNLGRNGALRKLGIGAVARALNVAKVQSPNSQSGGVLKRPSTHAGKSRKRKLGKQASGTPEVVSVGASQRAYVLIGVTEVLSKVLAVEVGELPRITDSNSLISAVRFFDGVVGAIGQHLLQQECSLKPKQYVRGYLVRLLVLANAVNPSKHAGSNGRANLDWSKVPMDVLRLACPDQCSNLDVFSAVGVRDAEEASSILCNRSDWGMFASMFACLWQEVAEKHSDLDFDPDDFARNAKTYHDQWGFAPHPCVLLAKMRDRSD